MNRRKKSMMILGLCGLLVGICPWILCFGASAQSMWKPSKVVQLGQHGNPGTSADQILRNMVKILKEESILPAQQQIEMLYKPGGGSTVLQAYMGEQKGNDHLIAQWSTTWISAAISNPNLKVSLKDLTLVVRLITEPTVIVVNAASPFKTVKDLIAEAKSRPNQLKQVGGSVTSVDNMYRFILREATGARWDFIPMPGGGERIAAILGRNADIFLAQPNEVSEYVRAGKMRIICLLANERQDEIPEVPILREAGIDMPLMITSRGLVAPPNTSSQVVDYWVSVMARLSKAERWKKFLKDEGLRDGFLSGAELKKFVENQTETTRRIMIESGMIKR